jgi:hypothetical protein
MGTGLIWLDCGDHYILAKGGSLSGHLFCLFSLELLVAVEIIQNSPDKLIIGGYELFIIVHQLLV